VFPELLRERMSGILELSAEQVEELERHYALLRRWNRVLNLTSIKSTEEAVERHYCESLFLAARLPKTKLRIADIGSGAGFPGFPVAVVRDDCEVTLIESHQRKAVFLREASRGRQSIRVLSQRAEDVDEHFDLVVSRAVSYENLEAPLKRLAPAADLLTGAEEAPKGCSFVWDAPVRMPWGEHRFLRMGRRAGI